jgi:hypothetical protein
MTGRWITVSLVALALAGCHKKEAAKPPTPPTMAETPATPPTTTATTTTTTTETPQQPPPSDVPATPPVDPTATVPTPPAPGVTPVTSPDAPPTLVPSKPIRMVLRPVVRAAPAPSAPAPAASSAPIRIGPSVGARPGGRPPPIKSPIQVKAERDILGLWTEQKSHSAIVNFTSDGRVTYVEKITDTPKWTGRWRAGSDGVVVFTLAMAGATSSLEYSAYPTASKIMAIAPHWTKEWGGSGQYAYERLQ